jgi:molybdate transport repressor ModE-like protein
MPLLWDDVRMLEAVATGGSVSRAARVLGVSPATVYRRITALEETVGHTCLARGPGKVKLTELGRALATVGTSTRQALDTVTSRARLEQREVTGEVSLTTVDGLLPFVTGPIAEVTSAHPLRVVLVLGDDGPSVREREVDLAVGIMRSPPPGCWGRRLAKLPYGVFGTPAAIARKPAPRWVARAHPEGYSPESAWERENVVEVAARARFDALVALVARGVGIGLMPRAIAREHGLVELPSHRANVVHLERTAWLLTHPDLRKTARVKVLMDALVRRFAMLR